MKICPVGAELFRVEDQTDRHTCRIFSPFSQFSKCA